MQKVLIVNSHGNNRGDECAQRAMIENILQLRPETHFTIMVNNPAALDIGFEDKITKIHPLVAGKRNLLYLLILMWVRITRIRIPFVHYDENFQIAIQEISTSDVVISSPGGPYIGALYRGHELTEHLFLLALSILWKKTIMIYAPSMGPFADTRWRNVIRRYILNRVKVISVRDPISYQYVKDLGLKRPKIVLTADSAFQSLSETTSQKNLGIKKYTEKNTGEMLIGVTPTAGRWNYRGQSDMQSLEKEYTLQFRYLLERITAEFRVKYLFFPQLYGREDDVSFIREIVNGLDKSKAEIIDKKYSSSTQLAIISHLDFFIGNRYHSIIFSLMNIIPCLAIAYEHKTSGIMNEFGLEEYVLPVSKFSSDRVYDKFLLMMEKKELIQEKIMNVLPSIQKRAAMNTALALALLSEHQDRTILV